MIDCDTNVKGMNNVIRLQRKVHYILRPCPGVVTSEVLDLDLDRGAVIILKSDVSQFAGPLEGDLGQK